MFPAERWRRDAYGHSHCAHASDRTLPTPVQQSILRIYRAAEISIHLGRNNMKSLLVAVLMATFALAGCNTVQGVGKDVERGGERLQDAADRRK